MVVAFDARSVTEARAVVELLESNQIPALVNLEVDGILFPWQEPPSRAAARVMVPSTMLGLAQEILRRVGHEENSARPFPAKLVRSLTEKAAMAQARDGTFLRRLEVPRPAARAPELREPPAPESTEDEDDGGPLDFELPEPSPLAMRILLAMLAVALGIAFQRTLEQFFDPHEVLARFAARSPAALELWRLVTAGFLHVGLEHLASNAAFGILLGVVLFGTHEMGATALVWLVASMVGLFTESSLSTAGVLIAGASAGNYGLVGLWAHGQLDRSRVSLLPRREVMRTAGILLLLVPGALTPITATGTKIAVIAHAAGFVTGFLLGYVFKRRLLAERFASVTRRARVGAAITAVILAATLIQVAFLLLP
jgi:rhomboid protease GluP